MSPLQRLSVLLALASSACGQDVPVDAPTVGVTASAPRSGAPLSIGSDKPGEGLPPWRFTEVSKYAGFDYAVHFSATEQTTKVPLWSLVLVLVSGVAAGDYDGDGFTDLYVVHGDSGSDMLFHNRGDGTFVDVAAKAGLATAGARSAGPLFADYDGDGRLDLFIGGIEDTAPRLMKNRDGTFFDDVTAITNLGGERVMVTASMGDYDLDGDLDLAVGRWGSGDQREHLFRHDGVGHFQPAGKAAGMNGFGGRWVAPTDFSFTPNFLDLDEDGRPDVVWSSDFSTTQYFMNVGTPGMDAWKTMRPMVLADKNGMGSAIGDFDNDGHLDWFVTSIFNYTVEFPPQIGNRLYRNIGGGNLEDVTEKAGVKNAGWAWGTCFQDFNNDGFLDLYVANGYSGRPGSEENLYVNDPARLFIGNGDGTFTDRAPKLGTDDTQLGRGVVCFDYDNDGDIDVFVANSEQPPLLYRNELAGTHSLDVKLSAKGKNSEGIGAVVQATANGITQTRLIRAGSNYASQDPAIAHFGLARTERVEKLRVVWLDKTEQTFTDVAADQRLVVVHP